MNFSDSYLPDSIGSDGGNITNITGNTSTSVCGYDFQESAIERRFVLIVMVMSSICLFGTFGNLLIIVVLSQPRMRSANGWFLIMLALADTSVMACTFLLYVVEVLYDYFRNFTLYALWHRYVKLVYVLSHISQNSSIYLTVSATIERFISLWYPGYSKFWCNQRVAYGWVALVFILVTGSVATKYLELTVLHFQQCPEFGMYQLAPSDLLRNQHYQSIHGVWFTSIAFVFLPFMVLTVLNSLIFYRLRYSSRFTKRGAGSRRAAASPYAPQFSYVSVSTRTQYAPMQQQQAARAQSARYQSHKNGINSPSSPFVTQQTTLSQQYRLSAGNTRSRRREKKQKSREATVVLFVVVVVFLICNAPAVALTLAEQIDKAFLYDNPDLYSFSRDGINLLTVVNSSANMIIYLICGGEFRKELKKICLCKMWIEKQLKPHSMHEVSSTATGQNSCDTSSSYHHASSAQGPDQIKPFSRPMSSDSTDSFGEESTEASMSLHTYYDYMQIAPIPDNRAANGGISLECQEPENRQPVTYYLAQESIRL